MKIIFDIFGAHIELSNGFAWLFVGLLALAEIYVEIKQETKP